MKQITPLEILDGVDRPQSQHADREPAPNIFAIDISQNYAPSYTEGPARGAPVTIVIAEDFACPFSERVSGSLDELVKDYNDKVRVVFKNMVVHPQVINAHLAGCAAAKQGKFQQWKRTWWEKGFKAHNMDDANIEAIAEEIGLDIARFKTDKNGEQCKSVVQADMQELDKFKVAATPTLYVNGTRVDGARSKEELKQMIDAKLKMAPAADYYDKVVMTQGLNRPGISGDSFT